MRLSILCAILSAVPGIVAVQSIQRNALKFALRIPKLFDAEFPHGGALKVPRGAVKQLEFSIGSPAADRISDGAVSVLIDGAPFDPIIVHQGGRILVTIKASEEPDLFSSEKPTRVRIGVRGDPDLGQEWIVDRHDLPFAIETSGDDEGVPVDLQLTAPGIPLLFGKTETRPVTFKGTVNRKSAQLTFNGQPATLRTQGPLSSQFSAPVQISSSQKEIVIEATGIKSDSCRLVIPINRF